MAMFTTVRERQFILLLYMGVGNGLKEHVSYRMVILNVVSAGPSDLTLTTFLVKPLTARVEYMPQLSFYSTLYHVVRKVMST